MHKKNIRQFWQGKGFYVALAVVILGSALASYLAISAMMQRLGEGRQSPQTTIDGQEDIPWNEPITQAETKKEDVKKPSATSSAGQNGSSSAQPSPAQQQPSGEPPAVQTARGSSFTWPVQGGVLQAFSGNDLVFSETMQDWRTHNGVDLSAAAGAPVKTPVDGTVSAVAQDGQWGGVVEITTADTTTVRLCGIAGISVKQGDILKQGASLGTMGEVPAEIASAAHLHMEVVKQGAFENPQDYLPD